MKHEERHDDPEPSLALPGHETPSDVADSRKLKEAKEATRFRISLGLFSAAASCSVIMGVLGLWWDHPLQAWRAEGLMGKLRREGFGSTAKEYQALAPSSSRPVGSAIEEFWKDLGNPPYLVDSASPPKGSGSPQDIVAWLDAHPRAKTYLARAAAADGFGRPPLGWVRPGSVPWKPGYGKLKRLDVFTAEAPYALVKMGRVKEGAEWFSLGLKALSQGSSLPMKGALDKAEGERARALFRINAIGEALAKDEKGLLLFKEALESAPPRNVAGKEVKAAAIMSLFDILKENQTDIEGGYSSGYIVRLPSDIDFFPKTFFGQSRAARWLELAHTLSRAADQTGFSLLERFREGMRAVRAAKKARQVSFEYAATRWDNLQGALERPLRDEARWGAASAYLAVAAHRARTGKWPATLEEAGVTWLDPATDRPFSYVVDSRGAEMRIWTGVLPGTKGTGVPPFSASVHEAQLIFVSPLPTSLAGAPDGSGLRWGD